MANQLEVSKSYIESRLARVLRFEVFFVLAIYLISLISILLINQRQQLNSQRLVKLEAERSQYAEAVNNLDQALSLFRAARLEPTSLGELNLNSSLTALLAASHQDWLALKQAIISSQGSTELKNRRLDQAAALQTIDDRLAEILSELNGFAYRNGLGVGPADETTVKTRLTEIITLERQLQINGDELKQTIESAAALELASQAFYRQLLFIALALQGLAIIVSLIILAKRFVLPSFSQILEKLIKQNLELRQVDSLKTEFLSVASHQFKSPLTAIKVSLDLLGQTTPDQPLTIEQRGLIRQAVNTNQEMIKLVSNLLNVSRIEQGRFQPKPVPTDIVPLLRNLVEQSAEIAQQNQVKLLYQFATPELWVNIDPVILKEAMQNLIDNAINYNRRPGEVRLATRTVGDQHQIIVSDTGHGIPPSDMNNLFSKFYRGQNARSLRPDGSGLGLFLVKEAIESFYGTIQCQSELEKGTTFIISLPVMPTKVTVVNNEAPVKADQTAKL